MLHRGILMALCLVYVVDGGLYDKAADKAIIQYLDGKCLLFC